MPDSNLPRWTQIQVYTDWNQSLNKEPVYKPGFVSEIETMDCNLEKGINVVKCFARENCLVFDPSSWYILRYLKVFQNSLYFFCWIIRLSQLMLYLHTLMKMSKNIYASLKNIVFYWMEQKLLSTIYTCCFKILLHRWSYIGKRFSVCNQVGFSASSVCH